MLFKKVYKPESLQISWNILSGIKYFIFISGIKYMQIINYNSLILYRLSVYLLITKYLVVWYIFNNLLNININVYKNAIFLSKVTVTSIHPVTNLISNPISHSKAAVDILQLIYTIMNEAVKSNDNADKVKRLD